MGWERKKYKNPSHPRGKGGGKRLKGAKVYALHNERLKTEKDVGGVLKNVP